MRDQFDISGVFETTEFEIGQVACTWFARGWHGYIFLEVFKKCEIMKKVVF